MKMKKILSFFVSLTLIAGILVIPTKASADTPREVTKNILIYKDQLVELPDNAHSNIQTTSDSTPQFDTIYNLSGAQLVKAAQAANYLQSAIGSDNKFNFITANYLVNYRTDMTTLKTVDRTARRSDSNVDAMTNQVEYILDNYVNANLAPEVVYNLKQLIRKAYEVSYDKTNFLGLYYRKKARKTTYRYNIFYALDGDNGSLLCLPISFTIEVDIYKKKILFITIEERRNYSCRVEAMEIKVD